MRGFLRRLLLGGVAGIALMAWGEQVREPHAVARAAKDLAQRVREWDLSRSTKNEERMLMALADYEKAVKQPW